MAKFFPRPEDKKPKRKTPVVKNKVTIISTAKSKKCVYSAKNVLGKKLLKKSTKSKTAKAKAGIQKVKHFSFHDAIMPDS